MREIKFRAWDKIGKILVEVHSIDFFNEEVTVINKKDSNFIYRLAFKDVELIQYTGLKDKNSVKIYEGDIVKWENTNWEIMFVNGEFLICSCDGEIVPTVS